MRLVIIGLLLINGCKTASQAVSEPEFMTFEHDNPHSWTLTEYYELEKRFSIYRVHKKSWNIDYGFAPDCTEGRRKKLKPKVVEAIHKAINLWLSPIESLHKRIKESTDKQIDLPAIVNQIHIHEKEEIFEQETTIPGQKAYSTFDQQQIPNDKDEDEYINYYKNRAEEMSIVFNCSLGRAFMLPVRNTINMYYLSRRKPHIPDSLFPFSVLLHEIGHVFGLADTYVDWNNSTRRHMVSTGVHDQTIGHQVISVMGPDHLLGFSSYDAVKLTRDDQAGITWFYAHVHMDYLKLDTCPPAYQEESFDRGKDEPTVACRPKHPFLFAMKHKNYSTARLMLNKRKVRKSIDINVQYKDGEFTALHYAVASAPIDLIELILKKFYNKIDFDIKGTIVKEVPPLTPLELANFLLEKVTKHDMPELINRYKNIIDLLSNPPEPSFWEKLWLEGT